MKSLTLYIIEKSTPDWTEDNVKLKLPNGEENEYRLNLSWSYESASPFILNVENKEIVLTLHSDDTHYDIIKNDIDDCWEKTNLDRGNYFYRLERNLSKNSVNRFYKMFPQLLNIRFGRLWDLRPESKDVKLYGLPCPVVVIGFWEEMESEDWYKYTKLVLDYYGKKCNRKIDFDNTIIVGIDNNCNLFQADFKDKIELEKRSKETSQEIKDKLIVHLANQKEKEKFFKLFKLNRDKKNQEEYNKEDTQHHTEVEHNFYNRKIRDYKTGKERPYDGDSYHTNIKPLDD